jgi:hypothetical protein
MPQPLEVADRLTTQNLHQGQVITGSNPRRAIAADSPARSPVHSANSRNGNAPANPTSRSSSPTSSSPSAHELPCAEEVHRPSQITIFKKSHSD